MVSKSFVFFAAAGVALADQAPAAKFNLYWGQKGTAEDRLKTYCSESNRPDFITMAFVNWSPQNAPKGKAKGYPGINFSSHCWGTSFKIDGKETMLYNHCATIKEDMKYCQDQGVKMLLSIGGEWDKTTSDYSLKSKEEGKEFADQICKMFGPPGSKDSPRPFGDNVIDGIDFDLEIPAQHFNSEAFTALAENVRKCGKFETSASPQCPISKGESIMEDLMKNVELDYVFTQFYNNPKCDLRAETINFDEWQEFVSTKAKSRNAKIFVGVLGSNSSSLNPQAYVGPKKIEEEVCKYANRPNFGGISVWDLNSGRDNIVGKNETFNDRMQTILKKCAPKGPSKGDPNKDEKPSKVIPKLPTTNEKDKTIEDKDMSTNEISSVDADKNAKTSQNETLSGDAAKGKTANFLGKSVVVNDAKTSENKTTSNNQAQPHLSKDKTTEGESASEKKTTEGESASEKKITEDETKPDNKTSTKTTPKCESGNCTDVEVKAVEVNCVICALKEDKPSMTTSTVCKTTTSVCASATNDSKAGQTVTLTECSTVAIPITPTMKPTPDVATQNLTTKTVYTTYTVPCDSGCTGNVKTVTKFVSTTVCPIEPTNKPVKEKSTKTETSTSTITSCGTREDKSDCTTKVDDSGSRPDVKPTHPVKPTDKKTTEKVSPEKEVPVKIPVNNGNPDGGNRDDERKPAVNVPVNDNLGGGNQDGERKPAVNVPVKDNLGGGNQDGERKPAVNIPVKDNLGGGNQDGERKPAVNVPINDNLIDSKVGGGRKPGERPTITVTNTLAPVNPIDTGRPLIRPEEITAGSTTVAASLVALIAAQILLL